jgi:peroxiredoxin
MPEFEARGTKVAGVVVDPVETNAGLARSAGIAFPILSDPALELIDAFGLRHVAAHDGKDIALSTSVLVDGEGVVRWTYVARNVRLRPEPEAILAAIDALPPAPGRGRYRSTAHVPGPRAEM